jgi:light-regulated signal transduction histidine kinase (bacteriophytochrome)
MVGAMMDVSRAKLLELELQRLYSGLEERVRLRTLEIEASHEALEAFTYSVSHDLRAPLRHITGFLQLLARGNSEKLDAEGRRYLSLVLSAAEKMAQLIDALLSFSRVGKTEMRFEEVNLEVVLKEVIQGVSEEISGREVKWQISPLPKVWADLTLIRQVVVNLIENALKYTRKRLVTEIEVGVREDPNETVIFIKDNGVGFDMKYIDKLFCVFQRLHSERDFEGTGVGLANVKRIIGRHGGRVWAEGEVEKGACFFFTLPRHPVSGERGGER